MSQQTLADWLTRKYPTAKKLTLRRMVADGRVKVNGRIATRYAQPTAEADVVTVEENPAAGRRFKKAAKAVRRRANALDIVFEDDDLLIVNKPTGLLTSTVPNEPRPTLLAMVTQYVKIRRPAHSRKGSEIGAGLVHRIDRDASGLLVFTKTESAYDSLKTQFFYHRVERVYHAVVHGTLRPPAGQIESHLVERADGVVHSTKQIAKGQRAVTLYETVKSARKCSLVRVTLQTGRKHQIRVHLAEAGHPIVGDPVYGINETKPPQTRLMLVATKLGFTHPRTKEPVLFEAPLPDEMLATVGEPTVGVTPSASVQP